MFNGEEHFEAENLKEKNTEPHQIVLVLMKKSTGALDEFQDPCK